MSSAWTKGDRRAKQQLEKSLSSDQDDHVTRFALVRLLASKAEAAAAEVSPALEEITQRETSVAGWFS